MILAPWSTAQVMPSMTSESVPLPFESRTLTGMTLAFQATPAMPSALLVCGGDDAGDHRAVALVVARGAGGDADVGDRVVAGDGTADEVGVLAVDAGVDDRDDLRERALGAVPGRRHTNGLEVVLLAGRRVEASRSAWRGRLADVVERDLGDRRVGAAAAGELVGPAARRDLDEAGARDGAGMRPPRLWTPCRAVAFEADVLNLTSTVCGSCAAVPLRSREAGAGASPSTSLRRRRTGLPDAAAEVDRAVTGATSASVRTAANGRRLSMEGPL